jgi:hypothetical protein
MRFYNAGGAASGENMKIPVIALLVWITGCARFDLLVPHPTKLSESCIDGVKYIQFPSGASVKYTTDGRVSTCEL